MTERFEPTPDGARASTAPARPPRRWRKRLAWTAVTLVLLAGGVIYLGTRSWFLADRLESVLSRELGGEVRIGGVAWLGDGEAELREFSLRVAADLGEASEVLRADRVRVSLDPDALDRWRVVPRRIELDRLLLRASEDRTRPGRFNFMSLALASDADDEEYAPPPVVLVRHGVLEVGSHQEGVYEEHGRLRLEGSFEPVPDEPDWFAFRVVERPEPDAATEPADAAASPLAIDGRINLETFEFHGTLRDLLLRPQWRGVLPENLRLWWLQLDPSGRVERLRVAWSPGGLPEAEVVLDDVAVTIPIPGDEVWVRYAAGEIEPSDRLPRMRVDEGAIRLREGRIELDDVTGRLVGSDETADVRYTVRGSIGELPPFTWRDRTDWMHRTIESAPVDLRMRMHEVRLRTGPDAPRAVELPRPVANMLRKFAVRECRVLAEMTLTRRPPASTPAGLVPQPLESQGVVHLTRGRGAYTKFPYPLVDARGTFRFTQDEVVIESLRASGPNGGEVRLRGRVAPPENHAAVDIRIDATDVPVDRTLTDAFRPDLRRTLESLFDADALEAIARDPDAAALLGAGADDAFARVGGLVDFDLRLQRPQGPGQRPDVTGDITVRDVVLAPERFPYPLRATAGALRLEPEHLTLHDVHFRTPTGASGIATGRVDYPRVDGRREVRPDLRLLIEGDRVNPVLLAAIAHDAERDGDAAQEGELDALGRDRAARVLRALAVDGPADAAVRLTADPDATDATGADLRYAIDVTLASNEVRFDPAMESALREAGIRWPTDLPLTDLRGRVRIEPEAIRFDDVRGRHGGGIVQLVGVAALNERAVDEPLTVRFESFPLVRALAGFLPEAARREAIDAWERHTPTGNFDATATLADGGRGPATVEISRHDVRLTRPGTEDVLRSRGGSIRLAEDVLRFEDVVASVEGPDAGGAVRFDARVPLDPLGANLEIEGTAENLRFETPWLRELFERLDLPAVLALLDRTRPAGAFDAEFIVRDPAESQPDWTVTVRPHTLALTHRGVRVATDPEEGSTGVVTPGVLTLDAVRGRTDRDTLFDITGTVTWEEDVAADLLLAGRGPGLTEDLAAVLPEELASGLRAASLSLPSGYTLRAGRLRIGPGSDPSGERAIGFEGTIDVADAAFHAVLPFDEIDATLRVRTGSNEPNAPTIVDVDAERLRLAERVVTDARAELILDRARRAVEVKRFDGRVYGGALTAEGRVSLAEGGPYSLEVEVVNAGFGEFVQSPEVREGGGRLYGGLTLSGRRGDVASRRGRGHVRILDAELAKSPVVLRLLQLQHFMLPLFDRLDYANAQFFVRGNRAVLERIQLESPTLFDSPLITVSGEGEVELDTLAVDVRLKPRGSLGAISDLLGGLSDSLYQIHVTGTVREPKVDLTPVPGLGGSDGTRSLDGESARAPG